MDSSCMKDGTRKSNHLKSQRGMWENSSKLQTEKKKTEKK